MVYGFEKLSRQAILPCHAITLVNLRRGKTDVRACSLDFDQFSFKNWISISM
jgi:hypothetical protein